MYSSTDRNTLWRSENSHTTGNEKKRLKHVMVEVIRHNNIEDEGRIPNDMKRRNVADVQKSPDHAAKDRVLGVHDEILKLLKTIDVSVRKLDRQQNNLKTQIKIVQRNQQHTNRRIGKLEDLLHKKPPSLPKRHLPKPTLPGSSVDECIHAEVLQENLRRLVADIDLSNGLILDAMLANECLTESEYYEIKDLSKLDKTRKLASILGRNSKSKFQLFLTIISKDDFQPDVAKYLQTSYEKKLNENETHSECVQCFIIKNVEIKRIVDYLCDYQFIGLNIIEDVLKGGRRNTDNFWQHIFKTISNSVNGEHYVSTFKEALQDHYPHIAKKIHSQRNLVCTCCDALLSYPSGSIGDSSEISTTTPIPDPKTDTSLWVHGLPDVQENEDESQLIHSNKSLTQMDGAIPFFKPKSSMFTDGRPTADIGKLHQRKPFYGRGKKPYFRYGANTSFHGNYRMNKAKYKWFNAKNNSNNKLTHNRPGNVKRKYDMLPPRSALKYVRKPTAEYNKGSTHSNPQQSPTSPKEQTISNHNVANGITDTLSRPRMKHYETENQDPRTSNNGRGTHGNPQHIKSLDGDFPSLPYERYADGDPKQ